MSIPKRLAHIWIGPMRMPVEWMQTWERLHPEWEYCVYGNDWLEIGDWETSAQIREYVRRGQYAGAADLMRYEILWRKGGFIAEADSVCLRPVDDLFMGSHKIYTVYENEMVRGRLVSPILAAVPGHPFLRLLIDHLREIDPRRLRAPWMETGNLMMAQMIEQHNPEIELWPSHYFIPRHYTGVEYEGTGPVFADQKWGSTQGRYSGGSFKALRRRIVAAIYRRLVVR